VCGQIYVEVQGLEPVEESWVEISSGSGAGLGSVEGLGIWGLTKLGALLELLLVWGFRVSGSRVYGVGLRV
jgi:hypothetical protein